MNMNLPQGIKRRRQHNDSQTSQTDHVADEPTEEPTSSYIEVSIETSIPEPPDSPEESVVLTRPTYTAADIRAFEAGIKTIKDWSSTTVDPRKCKLIYWSDFQDLSRPECAKRYLNKEGKPCSATNILNIYKTYAPRFYEEKGIPYVPPGKRNVSKLLEKRSKEVEASQDKREKVETPTEKHEEIELQSSGEKKDPTPPSSHRNSQLDVELKRALNNVPSAASAAPLDSEPSFLTCPHLRPPLRNLPLLLPHNGTLTFICAKANILYGLHNGPELPSTSLALHSPLIRTALTQNPDITILYHGPEIRADTVSHLSACITPTPFPVRLPTHVSTRFGTFEQAWTPTDLEDLYILAACLRMWHVCDLVLDRWVEELHSASWALRIVDGMSGEVFNVLGFGPELLGFLEKMDDKNGFAFFLGLLASCEQKGWERMTEVGLKAWRRRWKRELVRLVDTEGEGLGENDLFTMSKAEICQRFHHHEPQQEGACKHLSTGARALTLNIPRYRDKYRYGNEPRDPMYEVTHRPERAGKRKRDDLAERGKYANPRFNAHHDNVEVAEEKLQIVRERLALFERWPTKLSDEETAKVMGRRKDESEEGSEDESEKESEDESAESEDGIESEEDKESDESEEL